MVYTVDEFIQRVPGVAESRVKCTRCGEYIQEGSAGLKIDGETHCHGCYYDDFSDFIDSHPIGMPGLRR